MSSFSRGSAAAANRAVCHTCGALSPPGQTQQCSRCKSPLHLRVPNSIETTVALLVTSGILLVPANVLPIMYTEQLGRVTSNTIMGGVAALWSHGSYPIALVIFVASVLIPVAKIFVLLALCWSVSRRSRWQPGQRTVLYRLTEIVGRWSMVDVFVIAILVALIQLSGLLVIHPGGAGLAFAGAVVSTMLAAHSFDTRLIWDATLPMETTHD